MRGRLRLVLVLQRLVAQPEKLEVVLEAPESQAKLPEMKRGEAREAAMVRIVASWVGQEACESVIALRAPSTTQNEWD